MHYMEELRYNINVTLHNNRKYSDNTFKQKLTSTLNENILVNPFSTHNVKKLH